MTFCVKMEREISALETFDSNRTSWIPCGAATTHTTELSSRHSIDSKMYCSSRGVHLTAVCRRSDFNDVFAVISTVEREEDFSAESEVERGRRPPSSFVWAQEGLSLAGISEYFTHTKCILRRTRGK